MKTNLSKKLILFCMLYFAFCLFSNAQIVHTDINPDVTYNINGTYNLDLNNDGINDFQITRSSTASCNGHINTYIKITPLDSNAVANNGTPAKLDINTIVTSFSNTSTFQWNTFTNQLLRSVFWGGFPGMCIQINGGHWKTANDGYLGLKIKKNGIIYYGWARLYVSSIFTIKDFAFNSIPNQPILAGETSCTTPTVTLSASGSLSFCNGDSVMLTANTTAYKFQWKKNGVNITGATSQTFVAKTAGTYKCKVTNSCGSKTSGGKTVNVPCRLTSADFTEQFKNLFELKIYPNPVSSSTKIIFSLEDNEKISLNVFDIKGQIVSALAAQVFEAGEHQIEFNTEKINSGIYFLKMQTDDFLKTEKLIVTK